MDDLDILTLAEAAERLGVAPSTLRHQVKAGRLHARLLGKTWVTSGAEVERYRRESLGQPGRTPGGTASHPVPRGSASSPVPHGTARSLDSGPRPKR